MIKPTEKQKEALNYLKYTNVFFHGGYASGKKTLCVIALVKYCIENQNKSCLFFSKGFVNTTVDVFIDVLKKGFPTVGFNYTKIDKKITFNNGSVVYFKDEKQENGIVFYDFVAGLNFNIEKIRCHKYLLCSNDIYNIAGAIYIYCSYRDNPFLSEKYKQDFIGYNNQSDITFICPPSLKTETLEEKVLKLKNRLADLEIKRLESKNKEEYELRVKIEDLKCTIKTLEGSKQVTDLQKFKDLYDELEVEYTFNGNCIWLRQNEKNIIGNDNCKSVIYFDRKGRFVQQGFFE